MTDSLPQWEAKRTDLFRQLAAIGDFRRGSITATSGKCGNPTVIAPDTMTLATVPTSA